MSAHIAAQDAGKHFRIYLRPLDRVFDWLSAGPPRRGDAFWAVRRISLSVTPGKVVGVIGRNGAGKTTLLRLLSGSLIPTEGTCTRAGRVVSLHGLSLALTGALTGRQNVEVAGDLVRLPSGYVQENIERIADFSELGEFFDRPVATYSAGMRTRLACATFAFLEADILVLDEALTGGDAFFATRWHARLEELMAKGAGVVMATHDLNAVRKYCHETIVLNRGDVAFQGSSAEAVERYLEMAPRPAPRGMPLPSSA
jgi:lipopolysaccharide transport system ATP-binding protein